MAHLLRLAFALVAGLFLLSPPANAAATRVWTAVVTGGGNCGSATQTFTGSTPSGPAAAGVSYLNSCQPQYTYTLVSCPTYTDATTSLRCPFDGLQHWDNVTVHYAGIYLTSPAPSLADSYCGDGAGSSYGPRVVSVTDISGKLGTTVSGCSQPMGPLSDGSTAQCAWQGTVTACGGSGSSAYCWVDASKGTGATCSSTTPDVPPTNTNGDPATDPPPKGYCPGTFNGMTMWVPCSTSSESTPKTTTSTTSNPDGSTATQTVSKNSTTTCKDGVCTTTTTTTTTSTPGGTSTSTSTTSQSQAEFCAANPNSSNCGGTGSGDGEGGFVGNCGADFSCKGDAIMCATAKAVSRLKCKYDVDNPSKAPYASAVAAGTATGVQNTNVAITTSMFDQSNALGSGSSEAGLADVSVTVAGHAVSLPFSKVNPYLVMLGNILVAVAFLLAIRIVTRG